MLATKLGLDLRPLQAGFKAHKERGIGVYTHALATRTGLLPSNLMATSFYDPHYENSEPLKLGATEYRFGAISRALRPYMKEYIRQHLLMPRVIKQTAKMLGVDIMFFPTHLDTPGGLSVPYAVTAHDMIHAVFRDKYYSTFKHRIFIAKQIEVLKKARLIIAISNHTKKDVVKYANINPDKVVVVHNGIDPDFLPKTNAPLGRFKLPEKFILNVGGIDWRKNVNVMLNSFAVLSKTYPDIHLVLTGQIKNDPLYPRFQRMLKERSLENRVTMTGFVTREELATLYSRALLFFYPSEYEGFGLPVLEAMLCGAPVISTNRSSIPEVAGNAACLLDPDEPDSFSEALVRIAGSADERKRLSDAGRKQAKLFSWDKCAKETWEAIASVS